MGLSLIVGLKMAFILGLVIGIIVDVDSFSADVFSKMGTFKDPHRAV